MESFQSQEIADGSHEQVNALDSEGNRQEENNDNSKTECNVKNGYGNTSPNHSEEEESSVIHFNESTDNQIDFALKADDNDTLSDIEDIKTDTASADSEDSALGSLPSDGPLIEREEETQDRSDGSDSGLGSETPEDVKIPDFGSDKKDDPSKKLSEKNEDLGDSNSEVQHIDIQKPLRSSLKRKCEDDSVDVPIKKKREGIRFDSVTVFYFPRAQGFTCVPSQGGSTLGMEWQHSHIHKFSLTEHATEQRRLHRQLLQQLRHERHLQGVALSSSDDTDTEEDASDLSESEFDLDNYYFLQPVPTRQRRALLRAAGVRKIEVNEKDECRDIRTSREFCGCACKGSCNPETCSCSLGGIKCQVDRLNFPCGCTRDGCKNTTGRIEFNPVRVRSHFIHTLMRVGLEKKNEENLKRQWNTHTVASTSCVSSYEKTRQPEQEQELITSGIDVPSCVNSGSYRNPHCEIVNHVHMHGDATYSYPSNTQIGNVNCNNVTHLNGQLDPYTSNAVLQGKGPPYTNNVSNFDPSSSNLQSYASDVNYSYPQNSESHFKGLQSFSASSFEEFAHNSHMTMFSHYGHTYMPDYVNKASVSVHEQQEYHTVAQSYDPYAKTPEVVSENNESQYTTLVALPYQSNKLETVDTDVSWYSHNSLNILDQVDQVGQDGTQLEVQSDVQNAESTTDTTENLGELIKNTMVESVIA